MKFRILAFLLLTVSLASAQGKSARTAFDRTIFYDVLSSSNLDKINHQLSIIREAIIPEKEAYEGALLMKKAGLVPSPKEKLQLFKQGRNKLEGLIRTFPGNGEYRFLRLIIQENAPSILNYNDDMQSDREQIKRSFSGLPPAVKVAIKDYSLQSKVLVPEDF